MKLIELMDKRNQKWEAAKAFLNSKQADSDVLSAEDSAIYDKMEAEVVALGKEIERATRAAALEDSLKQPTSAPIVGKPQTPETAKTGRASDEYRVDFGNALRNKLSVNNVLSTSPDADGGYLVPTEFERQIVTGLQEENVVRGLAKTLTTSAERKIPIADTRSTATWTAENAAVPESTLKFAQKELDAYKLTNLVKVSIELLQDSMFDLESYIIAEFARAFGVAEEEAFCIGNGTGRPTGIFTANGGEVGVTGGASINTDNLIDLVYSLKSPYRRNAAFLMKDTTVSGIRKLKDSNGQYLWQPSLQAGEPDRLLGYPLHTSPYAPAVAANALPIAFGDFSNYWIADRMGRTVQRLSELYAGNGQVGYLGIQRVDAKVILAEGIKLLKIGTSGGS